MLNFSFLIALIVVLNFSKPWQSFAASPKKNGVGKGDSRNPLALRRLNYCISVIQRRAAKIGDHCYVTNVKFEGEVGKLGSPVFVSVTLNNAVVIERFTLRDRDGKFTLDLPSIEGREILSTSDEVLALLAQEVTDQYRILVLNESPPPRDNLYPIDSVPRISNWKVAVAPRGNIFRVSIVLEGAVTLNEIRLFPVRETLDTYFLQPPKTEIRDAGAAKNSVPRELKYIHFLDSTLPTIKRLIDAEPQFYGKLK